jgi:steroid 5-alpha reductase family enzyme
MPHFPLDAFLSSLPWTAGGLIVLLAGTFAVAARQRRHSVMDAAWGLGFVLVTAVSWLLSAGEGDDGRRLLLLLLVAVWGLRLSVHIGLRARGGHEDTRYVDLLSPAPGLPQRLRPAPRRSSNPIRPGMPRS